MATKFNPENKYSFEAYHRMLADLSRRKSHMETRLRKLKSGVPTHKVYKVESLAPTKLAEVILKAKTPMHWGLDGNRDTILCVTEPLDKEGLNKEISNLETEILEVQDSTSLIRSRLETRTNELEELEQKEDVKQYLNLKDEHRKF